MRCRYGGWERLLVPLNVVARRIARRPLIVMFRRDCDRLAVMLASRKCQRTPGVSIRKPRKAHDGRGRSIASREEHFSERWIRGVDQGWIRVDQGGSGVYRGHILVPSLRETLKNVGKSRMAQLPAAGRTCRFIKLKERNHVFLARRMLERCAGASPWRSRILCSPFFAFGQSKGREER